MREKKIKNMLWAILGLTLTYWGIYIFLTSDIVQNIILAFAMSCIGAIMFGWELAVYQNLRDK